MENATKALLIAAAILIAILIISLGLVVYRMAAEQVSNADLSEAEAASFNGKFTAYEGDNKSSSEVNALLNTVLTSNQSEAQSGSNHYVTVTGAVSLATTANSISSRATGGTYYNVVCTYTKGLVTSITVTAK